MDGNARAMLAFGSNREGAVIRFALVLDGSGAATARHKKQKKKGATGITTVAPLVAGQWGRGDNRLPE
jgi:hypothetical protein